MKLFLLVLFLIASLLPYVFGEKVKKPSYSECKPHIDATIKGLKHEKSDGKTHKAATLQHDALKQKFASTLKLAKVPSKSDSKTQPQKPTKAATKLQGFNKFIDIIFGISMEPRDPKFALPWQKHPEFRKKASIARRAGEKVDTEPGFIGKMFDRAIRKIFTVSDEPRDKKWAKPWQKHSKSKNAEHKKRKRVKYVSSFSFMNKFIEAIFGKDPADGKRDPKWAKPWQTHFKEKEARLKKDKERKTKDKIKRQDQGGLINSVITTVFDEPKGPRDPKWAKPWQTHKKLVKDGINEKKILPERKESGVIGQMLNRFICFVFQVPLTSERDPKWAKPWKSHFEHPRLNKTKRAKKLQSENIFRFMNPIIESVFGKAGPERDPKWAYPWQKHGKLHEHDFLRPTKEIKPITSDELDYPYKSEDADLPARRHAKDEYTKRDRKHDESIDDKREGKWRDSYKEKEKFAKKKKNHIDAQFKEEKVKTITGKKIYSKIDARNEETKKKVDKRNLIGKRESKDGSKKQEDTVNLKGKLEDKSRNRKEKLKIKEENLSDDKKAGKGLKYEKTKEKKKVDINYKNDNKKVDMNTEHLRSTTKNYKDSNQLKIKDAKEKDIEKGKSRINDEYIIKNEVKNTNGKTRKVNANIAPEKHLKNKVGEQNKKTKIEKPQDEDYKRYNGKYKSNKEKEYKNSHERENSKHFTKEKSSKNQKMLFKKQEEDEDNEDEIQYDKKDRRHKDDEDRKSSHYKRDQKLYSDSDDSDDEMPQGDYRNWMLRPRDHISKILGLDDLSLLTSSRTQSVSESILKDLRSIYENSIHPLQSVYKYQDISNRHFSDAEIFATPMVLLLGPYSTGKSTFINYLLGIEFSQRALKTGTPPSHGVFRVIKYGNYDRQLDGTDLTGQSTFTFLSKFGQNFVDQLQGKELDVNLLKKVTFVEAPGILEMRRPSERLYPFNDVLQWFVDRADLIIVMFDYTKLDAGYELEAILDQLKGREVQTRIVLNKADQIPPEELIRVQGSLFWNLSPLLGMSSPPTVYAGSFSSYRYKPGSPVSLFEAQEEALLHDISKAVNSRVENRIAIARRHAVRVRNHAQMVDTYLKAFYENKGLLTSKHKLAGEITENPQEFNIYEGISLHSNISRYDLPDPDVYRDFFRVHNLYNFRTLRETCTYMSGCPLDKLDAAISKQLPDLISRYRRLSDAVLETSRLSNHDSYSKHSGRFK